MRIDGIVALLGLSITAVGQPPGTKSTVGSTSSDSVEKKISLLSEKVAKLEKEIESLQTTLKWVAPQVISMMPSKEVSFDPSSPNKYSRLDLDNGFVLVSLESAIPYLDGIEATLNVGNPLYVSYTGFKVNCQWGKRWESKDDYGQWLQSLRSKEETYTESLLPGSWTRVQLLLPNTKTTDFGYLSVAITTNTVSLRR